MNTNYIKPESVEEMVWKLRLLSFNFEVMLIVKNFASRDQYAQSKIFVESVIGKDRYRIREAF